MSAKDLVVQLKGAVLGTPPNIATAQRILDQLKVEITKFPSLPGSGGSLSSPTAPQELLIARETFETAALLSILKEDFAEFERHVSQVKTFYFDYSHIIPESPLQLQIMGLNLMCLLAQNRIADMHTEIERVRVDLLDNMYIKFPIQLEQYLMEGSYNKILNARTDVPSSWYNVFIDVLTGTVRNAIAECSVSAYTHLPLAAAQRLLLLSSPQEVADYARERGWTVDESKGVIHFSPESHETREVPAIKVIRETLSYAKELERIV